MLTPEEQERVALGLFAEALGREEMDVRSRLEWLEEAAGRDGDTVRRVLALMEADSEAAGLADREVLPERVPETFGNYTLEALCGLEPGGSIWRGQRQTGQFVRPVMIRIVRPGDQRRGQANLIASALPALVQMDHPGIARILDGGAAPGGFGFLVSEDVAGAPLAASAATAEEAVAQMALASRALAHAHAHGIAHGALSAALIKVTAEGRPVLTDFAGTLFRNGARAASMAQDVRALAGILGQLLDGLSPPARNLEDLAAIVAKGLSDEPGAGYRSAEAFGDDLARWQACQPVSAVAGTLGYRMKRALQRGPVRLGLAAAGVLAGLVALGLLMRS